MQQKNFLPYARQSIDKSDIEAVAESLKGDLITRGKKVSEFEEQIAGRFQAKYAVTFTSATTGLYAAMQAADVSAFDRFVTTPNSFIATVASGMRLGARPIFVDIDQENGCMNSEKLGEVVSQPMSRGRLVIAPVHFSGITQDMERLGRQIKSPNAIIIEDAAHAIGSAYKDGSLVGSCSYSDMTVFSFHAIKTMTTGEGGCVTTNDEKLYKRLQRIRNSGMERAKEPWLYSIEEISGNYHMTEMQAALGLSQLARLESFIEKRKKIVSWYRSKLSNAPHIRFFNPSYDERSCYHLMCLQIDFEAIGKTRSEVMQELHDKGIGSQYHYIPLYRHPAVAKVVSIDPEAYPVMEKYYKQGLSIPLYYDLEEKDVDHIAKELLLICDKKLK